MTRTSRGSPSPATQKIFERVAELLEVRAVEIQNAESELAAHRLALALDGRDMGLRRLKPGRELGLREPESPAKSGERVGSHISAVLIPDLTTKPQSKSCEPIVDHPQDRGNR